MAESLTTADLRSALAIADGTAQIGPASLPSGAAPRFLAFLNRYYSGTGIVITNAAPGLGDGDSQVVVVGLSSFLGVRNLVVTGVFTVSTDGTDVVAKLTYTLRVSGPGAWTWSTSFPNLPPVYDMGDTSPAAAQPALDRLSLERAALVVCTDASTDNDLQVVLQPGINFVGTVDTPDFVPLLDLFVPTATLAGTVVVPDPTHQDPLITPDTEPWEPPVPQPPPGILLASPLGSSRSFGNLGLSNARLVLYSPTDSAWMRAHPGFEPEVAFAATLAIPSAGVSVDVSAALVLGFPRAIFSGVFRGVSLGGLASVADLAGGADLLAALPSDVQASTSALERLSLLEAALGVTGGGDGLGVDYVYFAVGIPDLDWAVIPHRLTVNSVRARFTVVSPFDGSARSAVAQLVGDLTVSGTTVEIVTDTSPFRLEGETTSPISVPLSTFLHDHAPNLLGGANAPDLGTLTIDHLSVGALPGSWYALGLMAASNPAWVIGVGKANLTVSDVALELIVPVGGSATGSFRGSIAVGDAARLSVSYAVPGDFQLQGLFPRIDLTQLVSALCDVTITPPDGFDLTLERSSVLIEERGGNLTFLLGTTIDEVGTVAVEVAKTSTGWGFAAGVALDGPMSGLAGLSDLAGLEGVFLLTKLVLLVSSLDAASIQLPDLSSFPAPNLQGKSVPIPPQAAGLGSGFYLFAEAQLGDTGAQKAVGSALGLGATLDVVLEVSVPPTKSSRLFAGVTGALGGTQFDGEFGAALIGGEPELFLAGDVKTRIQNQDVTFSALAAFVPNGVLLSGSMTGGSISFWGLELADVALEVGIDLEGVPSLGVAATLESGSFNASFAIFLDSTDPAKSLLAGAVSDLTLKDVAHAFAGQATLPGALDDLLGQIGVAGTQSFTIPASTAAALDSFDLATVAGAFGAAGIKLPASSQQVHVIPGTDGKSWFLTDLSTNPPRHYELRLQGGQMQGALEAQVYIAPQTTTIGAIQYPQGSAVSGTIAIFGWTATVDAQLTQGSGLHIDAAADPLVISSAGLLEITADGGSGGPRLSVDTAVNPHFFLTGQVKLLGVVGTGIEIDVSSSGCRFELKGSLVPGSSFDITGSFTSPSQFGASGSASAGVNGTVDFTGLSAGLGKLTVDVSVSGSLDVGYATGTAWANMSGSFEFAGETYTLGTFALTIGEDELAKLGTVFLAQIQDLFDDTVKDAKRWLTWAANGLLSGIDSTAKGYGEVLGGFFQLGFADIVSVTQSVLSYGLDGFAGALAGAGATASEAFDVLVQEEVGTYDQIAGALASYFGGHADVPMHIDQQVTGHLDTPGGDHNDQPGPHLDAPGSDHVDQSGNHVDTGSRFHADTGSPHLDTAGTPHVDSTGAHTDFAGAPHLDQASQHQDTPGHGDSSNQ